MPSDTDHLFGGFRKGPGATLYVEQDVTVTEDVTTTAVFTLFIIVLVALTFAVLGKPGNERFHSFLRYLIAAAVAAVILVCTYSHSWYVGTVTTNAAYRPYTKQHIHAQVGLHVGLKTTNITLKGIPEVQGGELINYNERMHMKYGSAMKKAFKHFLKTGKPFPILWVAEYMATDSGDQRWGRNYRLAGQYAFILLWTAFSTWLVACILYRIAVRRGAQFTLITSGLLLLTNVVFVFVSHHEEELVIPFEDETMIVHLGWCYWVTLVAGVFTLFFGVAMLFLHRYSPATTSALMGVSSPTPQVDSDADHVTITDWKIKEAQMAVRYQ